MMSCATGSGACVVAFVSRERCPLRRGARGTGAHLHALRLAARLCVLGALPLNSEGVP